MQSPKKSSEQVSCSSQRPTLAISSYLKTGADMANGENHKEEFCNLNDYKYFVH